MTFYRHSKRERFENPLPSSSRIAVLAPNFTERDGVRCFAEEQFPEIEKFCPEILAGTVPVLLRLAQTIRITRAIVAFSGSRIGPVSHRERDLLWSAYQVPIFEQCLGPNGIVIARECEAHDGLHLILPALYQGSLRSEPCPCGRPEPRIAGNGPA
jgi:hypothetical protein